MPDNMVNFKGNLLLRVFGGLIFLLGFLLFLFIGFVSTIKTADAPPEQIFDTIKNVVVFKLLVAGIVPLIVGGYFTLMFKTSKDFFVGTFLILPAFILLHYVVGAFSVHTDDIRYILIQIFEIICAALVIVKYRQKWRRLAPL